MQTLNEVHRFEADRERVWFVAWSPNGSSFASSGSESVIRIWDREENGWLCSAILEEKHSRTIRRLCWSPNGTFLAAASFDSTVSIWERRSLTEWEHVGCLEGHEKEVKGVAWHPDEGILATCGRDKTIWFWEVLGPYDYEPIDVKTEHQQDVKVIEWDPSGSFLASGSYDDTIKIWQEEHEEWMCVQTLGGHTSTVWDLAFDAKEDRMMSCGDDGSILVWKIVQKSFKAHLTLLTQLTGYHERTIYSIHVSESGTIATGCGDDGIRVFEKDEETSSFQMTYHRVRSHDSDVNCVRWNPAESNLLLSAGDDGYIKLWTYGA